MRWLFLACLWAVCGCGDSAAPAGNNGEATPGGNTGPVGNSGAVANAGPAGLASEPEPEPEPVTTGHRVGDVWEYHYVIPGVVDRTSYSRILALDATRVQLLEVRDVGRTPVREDTLRIELFAGELWIPDPEKLERGEDEQLEVSGQSLQCQVWSDLSMDIRYWYCPELPLFPLVRMEAAGSHGQLTSFEPGE